jgi:predicted HAD superfamily Cof-like phosphohydrolase
MRKSQQQVLEFHETFKLLVNTRPSEPSGDIRELRIRLIAEELAEMCFASGIRLSVLADPESGHTNVQIKQVADHPVDLVEVADALTDINYVTDGAGVCYGFDLEPFAEEVHRSNMTKAWTKEEVDTVLPSDHTAIPTTGGRFIVRRPDGKVVKSPSYSPANLKPILDQQLLSTA